MATLTENEIKEKLVTAFTDDSISGDLVSMMATFSARFLFLEQFMSAGILMEGSFSRSIKLSSRITHAADNFYSVPRGNNRKIRLKNVSVMEAILVKKFDVFSTYGKYKMVFADDYSLIASNASMDIDCYLTLDSVTKEIPGNGMLYLDLEDENVSEDIMVYDKDFPSDVFTVIREVDQLPGEDDIRTVAAVTQPGYSVKLWRNVPFNTDKTYVVRYLKCPDPDIEDIALSQIINIPKLLYVPFSSGGNSEVVQISATVYPLADLDKIYEYTICHAKYGNTIKTKDQIAVLVSEYFPEFQGFNVDVQISGSVNTIKVYYVTDWDKRDQDLSYIQSGSGNYARVEDFIDLLSNSYFVTSDISFSPATVYDPFSGEASGSVVAEESDSESDSSGETDVGRLPIILDIYIRQSLRYDIVEDIVRGYQAKVGEPWNPFQMISDLVSDPTVGPYIKYAEVTPKTYMAVEPMDSAGSRVLFSKNFRINYH